MNPAARCQTRDGQPAEVKYHTVKNIISHLPKTLNNFCLFFSVTGQKEKPLCLSVSNLASVLSPLIIAHI